MNEMQSKLSLLDHRINMKVYESCGSKFDLFELKLMKVLRDDLLFLGTPLLFKHPPDGIERIDTGARAFVNAMSQIPALSTSQPQVSSPRFDFTAQKSSKAVDDQPFAQSPVKSFAYVIETKFEPPAKSSPFQSEATSPKNLPISTECLNQVSSPTQASPTQSAIEPIVTNEVQKIESAVSHLAIETQAPSMHEIKNEIAPDVEITTISSQDFAVPPSEIMMPTDEKLETILEPQLPPKVSQANVLQPQLEDFCG